MSSFVLDFQEIEKRAFTRWWKRFEFRGVIKRSRYTSTRRILCVTTVGYEKAIEQNEDLQTLLQTNKVENGRASSNW